MDTKELKQQLTEAKKYRNNGYFAEALAILHQINNEFPKEVAYRYLLASTYYESMNTEAAKRYVEEAIALDPNYKENYELLGDVYEKDGNIDKAKEYYEKTYELDAHCMTVGEKLIQLYLKTNNYEGLVKVCDMMISYLPVDASTAKSRALTSIYLGCILYKGWGLVYLKRYEEAIQEIEGMKILEKKLNLTYPNMYKYEDEALFKMYYITNNVSKTNEYQNLLRNDYKYDDEKINKLVEEAKGHIVLFRQRPEVMNQLGLKSYG